MLWRDNRAWREAQELEALLGPELETVTGRPASSESAAARIRTLGKAQIGSIAWSAGMLAVFAPLAVRRYQRAAAR